MVVPRYVVATLIKQHGINLVASRQCRSTGWFVTVTARQQRRFVPLKPNFFAANGPFGPIPESTEAEFRSNLAEK
jgi:hypothetical protein